MPGLGDLVRRLADDDDRRRMIDGDDPHGAADKLRPHESREPGRRLALLGAGDLGRLRGYDRELADRVHEHDADVAEMLELQRQLLIELAQAPLRGEVLHGGGDEALRHFERGFDLDPGGRAGIEDRDGAGNDGRKEIDHSHGDEKLGPYRPIIPKLLQHAAIVSTTRCVLPQHIGVNVGAIPIFVDHPLVFGPSLHN